MKKVLALVLVLVVLLSFTTPIFAKSTLPPVEVVKGKIEEIQVNAIKVSGKTITIDSQTVIRLNGANASISDLKVGYDVVAVCEKTDAGLVARFIMALNLTNNIKNFVIQGEVKSISQNQIVVNNQTISISDGTKIRLRNKLISINDLSVGDRVVVHGTLSNGVYTAKEIIVLLEKEFEIRSYITEIASNYIKLKDFDYQIFVDSTKTSIKKIGKGNITFSELKVGDPVEVHAKLLNDNYIATSIVVLAFKPNTAVAIAGTVSFIDNETKTFKLNELPSATFKFSQDYKGKVKLSDLSVGDKVLVLGKYVDVSTVEVSSIIAFKIKLPKTPKKP